MESDQRRKPPHDFDAEQATLGATFIKPAAIDDLKVTLQTDDFFFPQHREIYEAMLEVDRRGDPQDMIAVADVLRARGMMSRLDGGEAYLMALSNSVPTAESVRHYARIVREKSTLRRLIAACADLQTRAYGDFGDFDEFMAEAGQRVLALGTRNDDGPVRVGDVLDEAMKEVELKAAHPELFFVRTGLKAFDRKIGGYRREQLIVVAANPGGGKSSFSWNVAIRSARDQGVPNLVFSLEMSTQELIERGIGFTSMVTTRDIHRGVVAPGDWPRIWDGEKKIRPLPLYIYDRPIGIDRICAEARLWAAKVRAKLPPAADGMPSLINITVDYVQIVRKAVSGGMNEADAIANITRTSKQLAKELRCPVTAISQLNRENTREKQKDGKQRKPKISDLKGSGAIEADADMVIFPCPEDPPHPKPGEPPTLRWHADIIVGKNRAGSVGEIPAMWDRRVMGFFDVDVDDVEDRYYGVSDGRFPEER